MSNPFTRNQDQAEKDNLNLDSSNDSHSHSHSQPFPSQSPTSPMAPMPLSPTNSIGRSSSSSLSKLMRRASMASSSDNAIDEEEGEELEALQPPSNSAFLQLQALSRQERELAQASGYKPTLLPSGGAKRHVSISKEVEDPDRAYADPSKETTNTTHSGAMRNRGIVRTYSMAQQKRRPNMINNDTIMRPRRLSHDAVQEAPRRFLVDVEETMRLVLEQEDTDGNFQISITDSGPKVLSLGTAASNGYRGVDIRGTYMLSNLLQELALAREHGRKRIVLDESRLTENPVDRLSRMISQTFWHNLTRRIDGGGLETILSDPKNRSKSRAPRIYVPAKETKMIQYYQEVAKKKPELGLIVEILPPLNELTPEYTRDLNDRPGLLALAMREEEVDVEIEEEGQEQEGTPSDLQPKGVTSHSDNVAADPSDTLKAVSNSEKPNGSRATTPTGLNDPPSATASKPKRTRKEKQLRGIPFIVPGARFNELYNWDSYFISLGLVVDNMVEMAKGTVDHFIFEIEHYGKILNGNRTYYLMRSQPPFLTDMALQVYSRLEAKDEKEELENRNWLKGAIRAAIKEYHTVWMSKPRRDDKTGLSRFRPEGLGVPPETEASHFTHVLRPYAEKYGVSVNEFTNKYNHGHYNEPELDLYFMHDRAVRESGHDTSYRLEKRCADMATIDLNALLYKYEVDIATAIRELFDDKLDLTDDFTLYAPMPPSLKSFEPDTPSHSLTCPQTSSEWFARAAYRKAQVDKYCWNEGHGLYYDYDTNKEEQSVYETVTAFWPMWAGMSSAEQAESLVRQSLRKFEVQGGLIPGTEDSRGKITLDRPNRQWDYPFAWPPHQMLAWVGLERYGYLDEARRLAYRWCYMMTVAFVDFNGVVPEKFDAVKLSHMVEAEYGNQGIDFKFVPREGFGWMNAAYQVGLTFLTTHMRRAVAACQHPDDFFGSKRS